MTGKTQSGSPNSPTLVQYGSPPMASRPSVTPGQLLLVRVPGQRTREDGLDSLLRLPYLAPIRGMGETRRGPRQKRPPVLGVPDRQVIRGIPRSPTDSPAPELTCS
jgi:hypothetical protein